MPYDEGLSARLTAIARGLAIPTTELEVEVFEKTESLRPPEELPAELAPEVAVPRIWDKIRGK